MSDGVAREITQRELRNESGEVMRGVANGQSFTITRNGTAIARLIPLRRRTFVPKDEVIAAFASAPEIDADQLRADVDAAVDQSFPHRDW
ncbi:MAG: type II toxin-antitoxin system Phd/YefM family antitoxin [Angustibacter sp.]